MINAAQTLLKLHFPTTGLQCTTLGMNPSFDVIKGSFVQILHNGANHWVTVSTLDAQPSHINVYDSMFCSITDHTFLTDQICAIMHSSDPSIIQMHLDHISQHLNTSVE